MPMMGPRSPCRNLSSASQQTRQKMRECHGLVDSMIHYVSSSLEVGKSEDKVSPGRVRVASDGVLLPPSQRLPGCHGAKARLDVMVGKPAWLRLTLWGTHWCHWGVTGHGARWAHVPGDVAAGDAVAGSSRTDTLTFHVPSQSVENAVCVLRNLSYRLYDEMPPSSLQRLEGHRRNNGGAVTGELVGCFSPQSKKAREVSGWEAVGTETAASPRAGLALGSGWRWR